MSSSGSGRTITITGDLLEAKAGGRRRLVREGALIGRETTEAGNAVNEVEAGIQEEGRIGKNDEETALREGPLSGARVTDLGAMVGSMKVVMTSRGMIRGRPLVG